MRVGCDLELEVARRGNVRYLSREVEKEAKAVKEGDRCKEQRWKL